MPILSTYRGIIVLIWGLFFIFPASVQATTMVYAGVEELVGSSDRIVRGRVVKLLVEEDEEGVLWRAVQLEVVQSYLGEEVGELWVYQIGGEREGRWMGIPGDAYFWVGQEGVFFLLEDQERGRLSLNGLSQGLFEIRSGGPDGEQVERDLRGLSFFVRTSTGAKVLQHRDPPQGWAAFEEVLEGSLRSLRGEP